MGNENVIRPKHYTSKKIETIDVIRNQLTDEQFKGFLKGNIIKYISRYELKNGIEDLEKAMWYLKYLIRIEMRHA